MSVTMLVGDIHLGKGLSMGRPGIGAALNSRVADQVHLLNWILEQAIEHNATAMILTGDICEEVKPDYMLLVLFFDWLKHCEEYGIEIHIVAGNHDIKRTGDFYTSVLDTIHSARIPNCTVYKQIHTIYNGTTGFTLLPFRDRRSFGVSSSTEALARIEDMLLYEKMDIPVSYDKVLIGHLALEGSIMVGDEIDDTNNELFCPTSMFKGYNYVWMGHVHRPQVRNKTPYVAHIGSMDLSDFGETNHKKIVVVYDSCAPDQFKEIVVPSRPLRYLSLSVPERADTTELILQALDTLNQGQGLKDAILKIEVKLLGQDVANANRPQIEKAVYGYGVHYLCHFSESRTVSVVPIEKKVELEGTISPKKMAAMWLERNPCDSEEDASLFIQYYNETVDSVESKK